MTDFDKKAREIVEHYRSFVPGDPEQPKLIPTIAAALKATYNEGLEDAGIVIDAESARVLACQTEAKTYSEDSVNLNIRMMTVLLPSLAETVRAKKLPT